eukprot:gene10828-13271_t
MEEEKEFRLPIFYNIEYNYIGLSRLKEYSHQQLCLLGRLHEISVVIYDEQDIKVLDYIKETRTISVMNIITRVPIKIPKGSIPDNVEELSLDLHNDQRKESMLFSGLLEEGTIPSSVKFLGIYHAFFKHNVKGLIPDTVEEIRLSEWSFSPGETDILPRNIKKLTIKSTIGDATPLGSLPKSITDLTVYYPLTELNQIPPGVFPESLKYLLLSKISCPLEMGSLPSGLETLRISNPFSSQEIITKPGIIPESLKNLELLHPASDFNLDFIPKSSLTDLDLSSDYNIDLEEFPKGLLPSGLKTLDITTCLFSKYIDVDNIQIPNTIQLIKIDPDQDSELNLMSKLISKLFSQSESRLQIDCIGFKNRITLLSTDPSDPYIYYNSQSSIHEGFISKSNLQNNIICFFENIFKD